MGWWDYARRAAAKEFGRRYWRWFAAAGVARTVLPPLATMAGAGLLVWAGWRFASWWLPRILPLALTLAAVVALWFGLRWAWQRWGWLIAVRPALATVWGVGVVVFVAGAGLTIWWAM